MKKFITISGYTFDVYQVNHWESWTQGGRDVCYIYFTHSTQSMQIPIHTKELKKIIDEALAPADVLC